MEGSLTMKMFGCALSYHLNTHPSERWCNYTLFAYQKQIYIRMFV